MKAEELLQTNQIVIGPTIKGGSYLIGLSAKSFNKTLFENLKWETKHLLNDLISYSKKNSTHFHTTEYFNDINNQSDLKDFVNNLSYNNTLAKLVSRYISSAKTNKITYHFLYNLSSLRFSFGLTAPPNI